MKVVELRRRWKPRSGFTGAGNLLLSSGSSTFDNMRQAGNLPRCPR